VASTVARKPRFHLEARAAEICAFFARMMENACDLALQLTLPLTVEAKAGNNWGEAH
jgi:DNA polymerase I-like protein with 3'-5' exonuclease and polymerase domains